MNPQSDFTAEVEQCRRPFPSYLILIRYHTPPAGARVSISDRHAHNIDKDTHRHANDTARAILLG
jgi:hypothetical protein